jgi:hypothetical protein
MKKLLNRKNCFWFSIILTFGVVSCDNPNSLEPPFKNYFVKYYGGDGDQTGVDLTVNTDGSVILLGNWQSDPTSDSRIYLVKTDAAGNVLWEKKLGQPKDLAIDIEPTNDGNYIILANHETASANIDVKLIKISAEGSRLDSVVYGSTKNDLSKSLTSLLDGGFIVTGSTANTIVSPDPAKPEDQSDIFHYRCNSDLVFDSFFWDEQFGPGTMDEGAKVIQHAPGLFYVFGSTNLVHQGNPTGNKNLIYYSLDAGGSNGTPNFLGDFDNNTNASYIMQVPPELGGGYFVVGTETTSSGTISLHVAKLRSPLLFNTVNDEQFDREISVDARTLTSVSATPAVVGGQGYILLANEARETGSNIWLTKIDQNGNQLWSASYGSEEEDDLAAAVLELSNGKILVAGSIRLINNQYKMVLMKLNSSGQLME